MSQKDTIEKILIDYNDVFSDVVNVIEVAWLTDEQLNMLKSDFRIVANFFVKRRKNKDYIPDDPQEFVHVDAVLKLLSAMTGDHRYEGLLYNRESEEKEEVKNMCEVADRLERRGKEAGQEDERRRIIQTKLGKGKSLEEIADALELSFDEVKEIAETIVIENT